MTQAYKQKLLNWLCTMGLLLLVSVLAIAAVWYRISIWAEIDGGDFGIDKYAGPMGVAFAPYAILFVPLAFWHLCDFLERDGPSAYKPLWLTRYSSFVVVLLLSSPFAALGAIGPFDFGACGVVEHAPDRFMFGDCPRPNPSAVILTFVVAPIIAFACVSKAIQAARSHWSAPPAA